MNWLIAANSRIYDHEKSFNDFSFIDWHQVSPKIGEGDFVYIYCARPLKKIKYKCIVERINLSKKNIRNDYEYWIDTTQYEKSLDGKYMRLKLIESIDTEKLSLDSLQMKGFLGNPQGTRRIDGEILNYIDNFFSNQAELYPDNIDPSKKIYEGAKKIIEVNRYERNKDAREKCIDHYGSNCTICSKNFFEEYGEIGNGFIHVHHKLPLSEVGVEYEVDPIKDLIPICPNCHSMLHRKMDGRYLSVEELKQLYKNNHY